MPLPAYGVLVGTLNLFTRDNLTPTGSFRHGTLHVDTPAGQYECPVDVLAPSGVTVQYRLIRRLNHLALTPILRLPAGWQPLASSRSSGAIDYVRSPFVGVGTGARSLGFWLFRRDSLIGRVLRWLEGLRSPWIESTGDNALDALETQLLGSVRVFVFGATASSGRSVHDIHLNQGNPSGPFQHLNGIWQDGAVLIERPSGEIVAFLVKFATQALHTNNLGQPRDASFRLKRWRPWSRRRPKHQPYPSGAPEAVV
jgi:Uncharacterized conserved protein (DUF2278)